MNIHFQMLADHSDGRRTVVSHFNKAHKGRLARVLATTRSDPDDAAHVAAIARRAGMRVERRGNDITVVVSESTSHPPNSSSPRAGPQS